MSMTVSIDLGDKLKAIASPQAVDSLLRTVAVAMLGEVKTRIHEEGANAKGSPIGTYTNEYLKRRMKAPYNRTASRKVILSLTGQMENDFKVINLGGSYGLGFSNQFNADKAEWNEERYGKVYALTTEEQKQVSLIVTDWVKKNL